MNARFMILFLLVVALLPFATVERMREVPGYGEQVGFSREGEDHLVTLNSFFVSFFIFFYSIYVLSISTTSFLFLKY